MMCQAHGGYWKGALLHISANAMQNINRNEQMSSRQRITTSVLAAFTGTEDTKGFLIGLRVP